MALKLRTTADKLWSESQRTVSGRLARVHAPV
jgi:hypothetical protein